MWGGGGAKTIHKYIVLNLKNELEAAHVKNEEKTGSRTTLRRSGCKKIV